MQAFLSVSPQGFYAGVRVCVVYSDYSYLCSNDLQTLQAYRSCNVDHGCLCSHLNPPSRFPNTSRARLDTYIRNFLLFALQIYLMIDTIYRNLHYFHQAFSMLFYIQIPEGNHAGRFNFKGPPSIAKSANQKEKYPEHPWRLTA